MRKIAMLFLLAGLMFISVGGYQIIKTEKAQSKSLAEAKAILAEDKDRAKVDFHLNDEEFVFNPSTGDTIGILHIPTLEAELPIVEGTHEDELKKGSVIITE